MPFCVDIMYVFSSHFSEGLTKVPSLFWESTAFLGVTSAYFLIWLDSKVQFKAYEQHERFLN